ncbi:Zn-dependent protease [Duganella sp. BJB488]|uniref:M48 family metallopeptidase n=1 Tax=unclassified Duganella TaxID=2636909 RepID=UPI000E340BBB|nr:MULTISPECIES: M48 family metallopeptidase [unclassified Duganella]NVD69289.1 M48 family metallopeptidase [Duganella sp. BJB1802]RFP26351.1 Zn-dependent protease [Duganella sp. BJB489]RFP27908.1 Zn-dependent protease [Duganella sp. BJB488]RFP37283.1 Zn-dependent protease [Duganella sp. BJB480]
MSGAQHPAAAVAARYFDGRTSRLHRVTLTVENGIAQLEGDARRAAPLAELRVSERSRHAARKVTFADGAYLEIDDRAGFELLLRATGHRDSLVVRLQHSWRGVLAAAAATVALLALGYLYLLPAAAGWIADALPLSVERQLGQGVLAALDHRMFAPSTLPPARQQALRRRFAALAPPPSEAGPARDWQLVFRSSRVGPNAFALPSGDIVMTDQMVVLLQDDDAVMGVLAHELGHLQRRHMTRRIIQSSAVASVTSLVFGDISAVLSTLPALALDMKYSRDAEQEADDYAAVMLRHNGIPLEHLAAVFAKLEKLDGGGLPAYFSSHPPSAERMARLRGAR